MSAESRWRLPVALRYALIQLPEAALVAALLYLMTAGDSVPALWAWGALGFWLAKDVALYPLYRHALRDGPPHGVAALMGAQAEVVQPLTPVGQVQLRGERWRARSETGTALPLGERVRIVGHRGLTLRVRAPEPSRLR